MKNSYKLTQLTFLLFLFFNSNYLFAQERTISGTVIGQEEGGPLPGVNVLVKGTTTGTVTDIEGNYNINVPPDATLVFSFIGYTTQEVPVGNRSVVDVTLRSDVRALSEVVVIGYGSIERRDATGAVASVKAEDFNIGVIASPEQLVQGKIAGVQITNASGEPGAGVNIRIRGTSSVRGGNNPLFVVDGIPLAGDPISAGGVDIGRGTSAPRNPLNFLNPNDIEAMDVLKDASATAIYGSRGANGVVLITTKGGRGLSNVVEYGSNMSISNVANRFNLLNRNQFLQGAADLGVDVAELDFGADTDWQDEITRTAISHQHNLAYSNDYGNGNYRASVSYDNIQGPIRNSAMERITGRLNIRHSFLNDRLRLSGQGTLSRINDQAAPITDNAGFEGDLLGASYMANPTWPADPEVQISNTIANPNSLLAYTRDQTRTNRALINLSGEFQIINDLSFRVNGGFDRSESTREGVFGPQLQLGQGIHNNGRGYFADNENTSNLLEAFFDYKRDFGNSNISAILGYSYQNFVNKGETIQGWGYGTTSLDGMISDLHSAASITRGAITQPYQQFGYDHNRFFINNLFPEPTTTIVDDAPDIPVNSIAGDSFHQKDELQSFFGRVNYALDNKYLFTATLRADGSTRFGGNNKYGVFPSLAAAWRLSDEDFMPDLFDEFKLRAGWGITGNQEIPHNLHQQRMRYRGLGIQNDGVINIEGTNNVAFSNPNLQWEQTRQWNLGLDFGFNGGRFNGAIDVYHKLTTNLLMQMFAAQPSPTPFNWVNLDAEVINSGVELLLNYHAIDNENVGLNFNFNIAYNHNVVQNLGPVIVQTGAISGQGLTGAFAQRISEGEPLYAYFLRDFAGYDENGIAIYEGGDRQQFLGKSSIPFYNLGFNLNFRYRNFDVSTFLNGQFGHWIYNNTANAFFTAGSLANGRNVTVDVLNSGESPVNAPDVSTRFLERGDFLRMQNFNLGYNLQIPGGFVNRIRFFASAQNLFLITNYSGLDPEVNIDKNIDGVPSLGIDYTSYPRARTFTFGFNATF